jgi:c-di-GMP-binding flagellar brake protein YcgR
MTVESIDPEERKQPYKSRIVDMDDDKLFIEVPIHEHTGKYKRLNVGDGLSAYFMTEGGIKNYFHTQVLGYKEDIFTLVALRRPTPDEITRVQRRNFLRVPAYLEVAVRLGNTLHFTAVTEDLSGGGFSFLCDSYYPLEIDQVLDCWLLLQFRNGQIDHASFKAQIVRLKDISPEKRLVMLKFIEILEADQQKIVRYCLERQMDFRKV